MTDLSEQAPRRGMSFPFLLTVVLFAALLADRFLFDDIPAAVAGQRPNVLVGVALVGFVLWLWVLAAARRRATQFDGPIQTVRGSSGALQPILATILIVVGVNLAYSYTIPKWLGLGSGAPQMGSDDSVFGTFLDEPEGPEGDEPRTAEELLDAILGADDGDARPPNKTDRAERRSVR